MSKYRSYYEKLHLADKQAFLFALLGPLAYIKIKSKYGLIASIVALTLGLIGVILSLYTGEKFISSISIHSSIVFYISSIIIFWIDINQETKKSLQS